MGATLSTEPWVWPSVEQRFRWFLRPRSTRLVIVGTMLRVISAIFDLAYPDCRVAKVIVHVTIELTRRGGSVRTTLYGHFTNKTPTDVGRVGFGPLYTSILDLNPTPCSSEDFLRRSFLPTSSAMATELETLAAASVSRKRKPEHKTGKKPSKRVKQKASSMAAPKPRKPSRKMRKLFRKRAREYHSDEEEESDEDPSSEEEESDRDLDFVDDDGSGGSERDDEDGREGAQHGITRFVEGCRAFRIAFMKIMKKHVPDDPLVSGPILSAHKKLVAEKLAEEVSENKTKAEMKKEKQMVGAIGSAEAEKGHVKPATFLDAREKLLVSVATKGGIVLASKEQGNISVILKAWTRTMSLDGPHYEAAAVVDHKQVLSESSSDEE
ncbi:hypothetical protein B296_00015992 [Ensete ventricosum]|uniref:Uncharacterized protein n=1 Tax=Ensete ventricosum TaxID=4639 RepID=A0A427B3L5_ENSVE|nr:hypothetical protein B296_00015992 [Ensete ventricosum]